MKSLAARSLRRACALLAATVTVPLALAQTVAPVPASAAPAPRTPTAAQVQRATATDSAPGGDSGLVTLSPFEVSAELDDGYRAGGTLAGTRLRSELRDVAASVSVVTKDFLNDIASTDLATLLNYTVGTEVVGVSGNFSGASAQSSFVDYDGLMREAAPRTRVRGLSSADLTRDFFLTDIPLDTYITDRVEINRGANSMLFGLGSPAGIINNSIIKAQVRTTKTDTQVQLGRFGSHRETLDHNQVLVKDRLAFRIALLNGDRKYQPEFTFSRDERQFITGTWRPFDGTTLRANAELARRRENRPWARPPFDSFTFWWDYGRPAWNPNTNLGRMLGTPSDPSLATMGATGAMNGNLISYGLGPLWNGNSLGVIYEDPRSNVAGISGLAPGTTAIESNNERMFGVANGGFAQIRQGQIYKRFSTGGPNTIYSSFWRDFQITDPSIFDFYNQTLDGPNKSEDAAWNTLNVTLEQQFFRGLAGLELAYDKQNFDSTFNMPLSFRSYTLNIDINTHLPNGTPNPNFGRPSTACIGYLGSLGNNRDAYRATAYLDLDVARYVKGDLGRGLGRHVITANYSSQNRSAYQFNGRQTIAGLDYIAAESATIPNIGLGPGGGRRAMNRLVYLGPSVATASAPAGLGIGGVRSDAFLTRITSVNALYFQSPPAGTASTGNVPARPFEYRTFSVTQNDGDLITQVAQSASRSKQEFDAAAAVMQSKWFGGAVVTTAGWRRDDYKTYSTSGNVVDPATGVSLTSYAARTPVLDLTDSVTSFNWGAVAHTPNFIRRRLPWGAGLSLTFNKSDNFRPTNQRYDLRDRPLPAETGTTKEYGALLTFLDGKFELRATRYESTAAAATNSALRTVMSQIIRVPEEVSEAIYNGTNDDKPVAAAAWRAWEQTPVAQEFMKTFRYETRRNAAGGIDIVRDDRTSAVVPTSDLVSKGWEYEAVVNPTRQWRLALNASRQEAIRSNTGADVVAFMDAVRPTWAGTAGELRRITGAGNTDTIGAYYNMLYGLVQKEVLLDGSASPELRKWRWNAVTNYTFSREGRLRGWSVGGSFRWQDKITIGYPVINDPVTGPRYDVGAPIFGPVERNLDLWLGYEKRLTPRLRWRAQLNVRNVGDGNRLIPISVQPDGTIAAYRIAEPMVWTLTNSFSF